MASVEQSVELVDVQNGERREIDVVITVKSGDHRFRIGIEAVDRRGGTPWVESMITKHQGGQLTDRLILVAADGFTRGAIKKAAAANVEVVALGDGKSLDWAKTVGRYASLWFGKVDLSPESVSLTVKKQGNAAQLEIGPDTMIVSGDRSKQFSLLQFVHYVLKGANILKEVYDRADRENLTTFKAEGTVAKEVYALDAAGEAYLIKSFCIEGTLDFGIAEFQVKKNSYRGAAVGHGEFEIGDKKGVVAIVEKQGEEAAFSVNLSDKDNDPGTVVDLKP